VLSIVFLENVENQTYEDLNGEEITVIFETNSSGVFKSDNDIIDSETKFTFLKTPDKAYYLVFKHDDEDGDEYVCKAQALDLEARGGKPRASKKKPSEYKRTKLHKTDNAGTSRVIYVKSGIQYFKKKSVKTGKFFYSKV